MPHFQQTRETERQTEPSVMRQVMISPLPLLLLLPLLSQSHWLQSKNRTIAIDNHRPENELLLWSVKLLPPDSRDDNLTGSDLAGLAEKLAARAGLTSWGQVGLLTEVYSMGYLPRSEQGTRPSLDQLRRLQGRLGVAEFRRLKQLAESSLSDAPEVAWYSQEILRSRRPRGLLETCNDPFAAYQWHLKARALTEFDVNVTGVWLEGNYGGGVTVCLLDDGIDYTNPDLADAYNPKGSYDFNENDYDPMPSTKSAANHHGTRCAGEVAAKANNFYCGVGVAPGARVSMLKILDGTVIDSMEAMAYNYQHHGNYIYSSSWGPPDSGNFIDGPHVLGKQALLKGVRDGRHGYGSIFVVASGNGGYYADNCNFDGYATSEYTVTIGAVTQQGIMPPYAEECACMHGVTVSSGGDRWIVTTDWRQLGGTGCTSSHGGTSAAAPLAAGMIALMLSARPCLSWRDVQHILVLTAEKVDRQIGHYARNGAGLFHSHKHGFGMLTAWRMVQVAKTWNSVPPAVYSNSEGLLEFSKLPAKQTVYLYYDNTGSARDSSPMILEHVKVFVNIQHPARGQLIISLYSPSGTHSVLANVRPFDKSTAGLIWTFATIRCWGESPFGEWKLAVNNTSDQPGLIQSWRLTLVATAISPNDYAARIRQVRDIVTGRVAPPKAAKLCPKSAPLFTADGGMGGGAIFGSSAVGKLVGWLRRLPLIFNFLLFVSLLVLLYYMVQSSLSWCRTKYKQRQESRAQRSVSSYDYLTVGQAGQSSHSSLPPPPAYSGGGAGSGGGDAPPSYEEAMMSESTALLARYDARSDSVSLLPPTWRPLRITGSEGRAGDSGGASGSGSNARSTTGRR